MTTRVYYAGIHPIGFSDLVDDHIKPWFKENITVQEFIELHDHTMIPYFDFIDLGDAIKFKFVFMDYVNKGSMLKRDGWTSIL